MIYDRRGVQRFSFAVAGLTWAVSTTVCGWLFGLVSFDATMLAVSLVVMTVGSAVAYAVLVRSLVAELDDAGPPA